ncbi:MAG: hypothetical protein M3Y91_03640 [Actinomycetota bacterium]|nr:hypothetical protein [Actinomycetota bacterium]
MAVTMPMHRDPDPGRWGQRLGRTRLRKANLPLGGIVLLGLSLLLPAGAAVVTGALGAGTVVGVVGCGLVDPLPPLRTA